MINGLSLTPPTSRGLYCNCLPSCGDGLRRSGARLRFLCDYRHISDGVVAAWYGGMTFTSLSSVGKLWVCRLVILRAA